MTGLAATAILKSGTWISDTVVIAVDLGDSHATHYFMFQAGYMDKGPPILSGLSANAVQPLDCVYTKASKTILVSYYEF